MGDSLGSVEKIMENQMSTNGAVPTGLRAHLLPHWNRWRSHYLSLLVGLCLCALGTAAFGQGVTMPLVTSSPGPKGVETYSLSMQTLIVLTAMTFLPAALLMMTGFTRIIIVLGFLRTALGTGSSPPNMVLVGLALFLTLFCMSPVFDKVHDNAYKPFNDGKLTFEQAIAEGSKPLHKFMIDQTRETDLLLFADMAGIKSLDKPDDVPMRVLVPAFATSELKTAFQIGFMIFIPFLVIDLVVASILMSLGMMMVPPASISLPFKLMIFVLADGWALLLGSMAKSFYL